MIPNSRGRDFDGKQEARGGDETSHDDAITPMILRPPSSSRQWSSFRNPRIVRVSRSFGGKDRHSKVCTVRGLRDRRIRLSVPTAIQLYDLQDRLGLGQPSKAIDWLLEAAKEDIDKLPPLQLPPGFGHQFLNRHMIFNNMSGIHNPHDSHVVHNSILGPLFDGSDQAKHGWGDVDGSGSVRCQQRIGHKEALLLGMDKGKWIKTNDEERRRDQEGTTLHHQYQPGQSSNQQSFFPGLLNNAAMAFNPSSLSLSSQFGNHNYLSHQEHSSGSTTNGMSQLLFCPTAAATTTTMPYFFPTPLVANANSDMDPHESLRHLNHHSQLLGSSSQLNVPSALSLGCSTMRPFHQLMNVSPGFADSRRNQENRSGDGNTD